MGGGNAQKSATARARNLEKAQSAKNAGGGKAGMLARTGVNQEQAMAAAAAIRAENKKKKEERAKTKK